MITILPLNKDNRMLRAGLGKHNGKWFARVDLWWIGLRVSTKDKKMGDQIAEMSTGHVFVPGSVKSISPLKRSMDSDKGVPTFSVYGIGYKVDILLENIEDGFWWYHHEIAGKKTPEISFSSKCHSVHREFVNKLLKNN